MTSGIAADFVRKSGVSDVKGARKSDDTGGRHDTRTLVAKRIQVMQREAWGDQILGSVKTSFAREGWTDSMRIIGVGWGSSNAMVGSGRVAVVAERLCEQMELTPSEMSAYLKTRGCRVGGVTLGEGGAGDQIATRG
jgi:hypothetical protein